jgi:hypothetical protein
MIPKAINNFECKHLTQHQLVGHNSILLFALLQFLTSNNPNNNNYLNNYNHLGVRK